MKVDRSKIKRPKLVISRTALEQIQLILKHDHTLENMFFRIQIDGKGCDGFTYSTGFTGKSDEDFVLNYSINNSALSILMDPFISFFMPEGELNYKIDPETGDDGFVVINRKQSSYTGKFWHENENLVPPTI